MNNSKDLNININARDNASRVMKGLSTSIGQTKQALSSLRNTGGLAFAGITAGVAFSIKASNEYERSINKIVGLVGVQRDVVEGWNSSLKDISRTTGEELNGLADAMFFVTSAGLRGQDALDALEMSAKASASGLGETKVVADLVTSAMNAYGSATLSAEKATDILVATVREGKAEPAELASAMGMVLPLASEMGVSFDQVGASIAGMTRTGTNAQTASIQLRQILASLIKPSTGASDALMAMGTSAQEVRDKIRNEGLIEGLKDLKERFGDNEEASAEVFGNIRALSGVLDLLGANAEDNIGIFDRMKDSTNALNTAFKESEDGTRAFNKMTASVKSLRKSIGEAFKGGGTTIITTITDIVQKIDDWISKNPKLTQTIILVSAGLAGLAVVVGTVGLALLAINPVSLIITGVFLALGGAVALVVKNIDWFREKWTQLKTFLEDIGVLETWKILWDNIVLTFNEQLIPALKELWNQLEPILMPVLKALGAILGGTLVVAVYAFLAVLQLLVSGVTLLIKWWNFLLSAGKELVAFLRDKITVHFNNVAEGIQYVIDKIEKVIKAFKKLKENVGGGIGVIKDAISGRSRSVNDSIITNKGEVISTHPDDHIITTKDPSSLFGGGGGGMTLVMNNDFRNASLLSDDAGEQISQMMMRKVQLSMRGAQGL